MTSNDTPLWTPTLSRVASSRMSAFSRYAEQVAGTAFATYADLYAWSVACPHQFWPAVWDYCGIVAERGECVLLGGARMPGARWFPDARLNFAENLLRHDGPENALVFWGEDKVKRSLSRDELRRQALRLAARFRGMGVRPADRVAAYMPNMPETIVTMLATATLGATFTSASPDFGVQGVLDRFGQTQPKVLIACDGYWYNGKAVDILGKLGPIVDGLPSVEHIALVGYLNPDVDVAAARLRGGVAFRELTSGYPDAFPSAFERFAFEQPLYIVYSSGTTGVPKCLVHGAGNVLLQHVKEHQLHCDVRMADRLFYYTTCSWMMWNWLASGLASGATLLLYDGSPFVAGGRILWDYAQSESVTHFGTSAKYLEGLAKTGIKPREQYDLHDLRVLLSTGSPLSPESFDYVYADIKSDVQLSSISGGTDILSCFVLGNPTLPVYRGEIQCRGLGLAVDVWNDEGRPVRQKKGELVCTRPFPSMPLGFWNDGSSERYGAAYFDRFPSVWAQGDLCEITRHEGVVIHGRSDATLNPGGVRIGTAEIYRPIARLPEVVEALVIGQDWQNDVRVVLFVRLADGFTLDDELVKRIKQTIRENTTPRHVPAKILQVADIPRTKSGKVAELAVRLVVHGQPVPNVEALANPDALVLFANRSELRI
jgi:acetoacetyl-CoA synthetase